MRTIRDKIALVTGAGSGLGRSIALKLAREGARLHLVDLNAVTVKETANQLRGLGCQVEATVCDLTDFAAIDALVEEVRNRWGGLDILVNNAGIGWYGPTPKMTDDEWDRLMTINLDVPIRLTRRFLKTLLARPEAHVINMASICGWVCSGRFAAYHVSKFGLVGFSEAMRAEFNRHGLGVTAVCPGPVQTDLYRAAGCGYADRETPQPPAWLCTTADRVASKTVRAIYRNQALALVGASAYLLYYGKRIAPSVFYALHGFGRSRNIQRKAAKAQAPATPSSAQRNAA